ncbi:MAG: purine nucleoside permease [Hyphomicrobiales bacterium]|nr:purine nucleoside permease [Hyphomicrobiales bacterium]
MVVVTMYEPADGTSVGPGEYRIWADRQPSGESLPFPVSDHPICVDRERGLVIVNVGVGTASAAGTIMALGLDPRFDLTRSYWLVAGIAGGNPHVVPLGSACWAEWAVDGDLAHQIDGREIPADWTTGFVPMHRSRPFEQPRPADVFGNVYRLNPALVEWAFRLTADARLPTPGVPEYWLAKFERYPAAKNPPTVRKGDTLSTSTFWHGTRMNDWAADWVRYWTDGAGVFATSAMEDAGTLSALTALAAAGRADRERALILRTTSNFTVQPNDKTAAESLADEVDTLSAMHASVEACHTVGRIVVDEITGNWDRYFDTLPAPP